MREKFKTPEEASAHFALIIRDIVEDGWDISGLDGVDVRFVRGDKTGLFRHTTLAADPATSPTPAEISDGFVNVIKQIIDAGWDIKTVAENAMLMSKKERPEEILSVSWPRSL